MNLANKIHKFHHLSENFISYISHSWTNHQLREITLSEEEVAGWLGNLDTSKASGPDGIPARLMKGCSQQIAPSLCCLFNPSLKTSHNPTEWKSADVTLIHKKDS